MCGIFGIINDKKNQAANTVLDGLKKLEYRGYDSWGISIIDEGKNQIQVDKHIGKIGEAKTNLPPGKIALGHTRWATHGGVTDNNAHPHLDCTKKIAVIHNGIVENYQELKEELLVKDHKFISETDTEVIAHLIEEKSKSKSIKEAIFETFKLLRGSNAIAVLDFTSQAIIACRNGSPLVVGIGSDQYFLASDVPAFLKETNKVYFLNDGDAVILSNSGIKLFNIETGKEKNLISQILDWKLEDAEKNGFPHFLLKEIYEQLKTIPKTTSINEKQIKELSEKIKSGYKVILTGCGTASYCALATKYFFAQIGIDAQAIPSYEFMPFSKFIDEKTIVFAISQSGETADTLIAVKEAKKRGAEIIAVINARGSTLERLADTVLSVGAGPEIAVVSTKAFTSQLATLYLLTTAVTDRLEEGKVKIINLGKVLTKWLDVQSIKRLVSLAKRLMDEEHIYLIGKHINYPATLEFALKIKETSYVHAEPFSAGELKHGVITLIQKGTPCFVLASNDEVKDEVLSSAAEIKARGGLIIGVAPFESNEFDVLIKTPDLGDLTVFANIIVGQLLGYYLGVGRGADPDKPRNLAKSVTVK
ncbi:glutamine--fructose-6-phosphate transaminase (isomerizing) [Candidatus Roizmanbacteria bacterium CG_4_8_14_3_um_filter_34_9]|uniref:Glutamine--fructose-6-phosphate aminotransferase [isomerizing] n=3 Tax=Candidatus Roizmaniibacteriota TaxID=1752723 RepID=A0A2M7AVB4_9BACT|nr:MAG: glutamine--fructose-6-phosphate transaminase (isomerizing) [Candidatus Roizmanbacteria bacterium CG07_land_8_20_14_0_80_34_15]PIU74561.1 MAG: glutamine--fructose-6-phosphate transaminase (isomerizing) [Candidatus Roizmanbacteria bacterium CG06_land_8_20_14_3_00_34_14]PIW73554.1 MAG: glutamine--fructose-6-phosphate transaminase (isomerizing) [Candidatus Roizmanbacteria bacterium CG_4_8_14_3_um_filter_34_9]